ncbi:TIGR02281 family clan AA aspartic protease [Sphingomonas parva]|uniref:TIGR02281 family clan AA aspartic protease n=1 Tax=Sphingomonas parva TaxID=2555898 RepID=A0A4Y8ZZK5_9SPHN|nr:TIGR02281 family clan AA aspartic protease [Sphingomonas parva]TFI60276.1 TIGR02281 family clan AA aspartic protease [Sphingomonas parva]
MTGNGDDAASFLYLLGCLVLVASAFLARRIPIAQGLKLALAWVLIFGAAFVAFTLKDDFAALGRRVIGESASQGQTNGPGQALRIRKSEDGHFWAIATIDGTPVRFLIDSGATVTSLSAETARRAGIEPSGGMPTLVETANGIVHAERARIAELAVGDIRRRDLPVHISEAFGRTNVLGMNFLSSLSSWGVEGEWLILEP